ncbi:MAG TPA: LPS export ABC transporter permease LptF, partial [Rhodospirillales bacterium]|nr:LPS export ABC transporter permease LptF [Rhodospirillales bacterium]
MRTFDLYVLRQTLKPLAVALLVAMLVLLIERVLRLLDLLLGAQGPLKLVLEIVAFLVPHYIALALPISLLIGVMVAFNRLSRDGEIDALQCAGVGLGRQCRAALLAAVGVAVITGATLGYLKPYGRYAYQAMVYTVGNAALQAFVQAGVFTQFGDITFLVHAFGKQAGSFAQVFVFQDDDDRSTAISARDGTLTRSTEDGSPVLRLYDGVRLTRTEAARPSRASSDPPVGVLRFDQLRMVLGDGQAPVFRPRGADEREFNITELWQRRHAPPPGVRSSDMIAEFNVRLVRTVSVPFLPLFGIPLALGRRRSDRSWGIAAGLLILIVYNQVLDLGKNMAESGEISAFVGLWLPFIAFAAISLWLFRRAATQLPQTGGIAGWSLPPAT